MEKLSMSLNLTSFSLDESTMFSLRTGSIVSSPQQSRGKRLVCPNINQDNNEYHDDRYPCKDGVISDYLACGLHRSSRNLQTRYDQTLQHRRSVKLAHEKRATTVLLMILPSTTHRLISHPTLVPAAKIISGVDTREATTQIASTAFDPSILSKVEKVSVYGANSLSKPDQNFNMNSVTFGLGMLLLVLVALMLMVLLWREWDVRRAEEQAANKCAALVGGESAQWRKLVTLRRSTELRMELESRLEKRSPHSRRGAWERNSQFSQPLASPFLT